MTASNFPASLKLALDYSPETGKLIWLRDSNNKQRLAGDEAGFQGTNGYIRLKFKGKEYLAHRLIWTWMTGEIPQLEIDHRNGDRSDNRWNNLRLVTAAQQRANAKLNCNSASGHRGVYFNKRRRKWRAHYKYEHLGYFDTKEEAAIVVAIAFDNLVGSEYRRAV